MTFISAHHILFLYYLKWRCHTHELGLDPISVLKQCVLNCDEKRSEKEEITHIRITSTIITHMKRISECGGGGDGGGREDHLTQREGHSLPLSLHLKV